MHPLVNSPGRAMGDCIGFGGGGGKLLDFLRKSILVEDVDQGCDLLNHPRADMGVEEFLNLGLILREIDGFRITTANA